MKNLLKSSLLFFFIVIFSACQNETDTITDIVNITAENETADIEAVEKKIILWGAEAYVLDYDNYYLFQGDIRLYKKDLENDTKTKAGAAKKDRRWPNGIVYYKVRSDAMGMYASIKRAINHMETNTNVKFQEINYNGANYIEIIGCSENPYSDFVGRKGGRQEIGIPTIASDGNIIHEFCHALGLYHEHTRMDRNNYVIVNDEGLSDQEKYQYRQYNSREGEDIGVFDFNSIMLYGSQPHPYGGYVMTRLDGSLIYAQRQGLSDGDIFYFNLEYGVKVNKSTKYVNAGENVTYSLPGIRPSSNIKVTWSAVSNCTLVSGQETSTSTFKASGNGPVKVKVTINYIQNNRILTLEDSDVWVGPLPLEFEYLGEDIDNDRGIAVLRGVVRVPKNMKVNIKSAFYAASQLERATRATFHLPPYWKEYVATRSDQEFEHEQEITLSKGDNYLTITIEKGDYNIYQSDSMAEIMFIKSSSDPALVPNINGLSLVF